MQRLDIIRERNKIKKSRIMTSVAFWLVGTGSLLWFLIRVIPKPTRAAYPCIRAAAPIMSGFVVYLLSLAGSVIAFRKAYARITLAKYRSAAFLFIVSLTAAIVFITGEPDAAQASKGLSQQLSESPNNPMGVAKGIYPGRVAWVWDRDATEENCSNSPGDYWFMDKNTDQAVIRKMLAEGLKSVSGQTCCESAWDALFRNFNYNHAKGWTGYQSGEKIVVKINLTSMGSDGRHLSDGMNATPQLVLALLEQLVDTLGIAQSDITIGDPFRSFSDDYWNICHSKYPDVHYTEGLGTEGREQTELTLENVFFNSDDAFESRLPHSYMEANYLINMPCLKSHGSAGITLAAKNHQGTVIGPDQGPENQYMGDYLHYDYPGDPANRVMGKYRHIVDFMAHNFLGGNTLIYILDAIWSGRDWYGVVEKWQMTPFNDDWTSSLFLSQDAVAIESVGFDFLYNEYKNYAGAHNNDISPTWVGVQDYIHQAADPVNWPDGIQYDPSSMDHHSPVGSLGVHEHWNDAIDKKYSQNLGENKGIELVTVPSTLVSDLKINVTGISLPSSVNITGETVIYASVSPENATNKAVLWESSDLSIAVVDNNGLISPVTGGNVIITAMTVDGNKRASSTVTVSLPSAIRNSETLVCSVYPNPVTDYAVIGYTLNENASTCIEILTPDGKLAARSNNLFQTAGSNKVVFNPAEYSLADGQYICRVVAKGRSTQVYTARILVTRQIQR